MRNDFSRGPAPAGTTQCTCRDASSDAACAAMCPSKLATAWRDAASEAVASRAATGLFWSGAQVLARLLCDISSMGAPVVSVEACRAHRKHGTQAAAHDGGVGEHGHRPLPSLLHLLLEPEKLRIVDVHLVHAAGQAHFMCGLACGQGGRGPQLQQGPT